MDVINIQEIDDSTKETLSEVNIQAVEISNKMGIVFYSQKTYTKGLRTFTMPIGFLKDDIYVIKIFNGYEWKSCKFIVLH